MIGLEYQLAYFINKNLEEQGFIFPKRTFDSNYCLFTKEELNKITKLELDSIKSLNGLEFLKNLKSLTIKNKFLERSNVDYDNEMEYPYSSIKNFFPIETLTKLEKLVITDNIFLKNLNISNLKNLKKLVIFNAPNLETLKGLDELENLKTIVICGTNISNEIDYQKYIYNTRNTKTNYLDINIYPYLKNYDKKKSKIKFVERIGAFDIVSLSKSQVDELYLKCINFIRNNRILYLSKKEQIKLIYNYISKNVEFDSDGLKRRYDMIKTNPETIISMKNEFGMLHSSYNAAILGKSNCEGYVNLMKFILNILNIKSYNIHCKLANHKNLYSNNHSIIKIKYNNTYSYCDPSLEHITGEDYFMKTFNEIKQTHSLSLFEELNARKNLEVKLDGNNYGKHFK